MACMLKIYPQNFIDTSENQCIARNVLFKKLKELPKTRMKEVIDSIEKLLRNLDESAVVVVQFKQMKGMKNFHAKRFL